MKLEKSNIKKILVVRNDRFGEFLLNIPAIASLRRNFTLSKITLVVSPYVKELAGRIRGISEVLVWDGSIKHSFREKLFFLRDIRDRSFDLAIILNPSKEFNILAFLAGIPYRVGYNRKGGFLLNFKIEDKKHQGLKHEIEYNLDLIRSLGIDTDFKDLRISSMFNFEDNVSGMSGEVIDGKEAIIALHPWASNAEKEWPSIKFKELSARIMQELPVKIALIGAAKEEARAEEFCKNLDIINLVGKTDLLALATFLKRCKLLVTNDSGPMHLAAVLDTPVVAIFRKTPQGVSARRWGPPGEKHIVLDSDSIYNITVDEVLGGIKKLLV